MSEKERTISQDQSFFREQLRTFLEAHLKTKILQADEGGLRMHILASKANRNTKIKDKMINYKLLRLEERIFRSENEFTYEDAVISSFLLEELFKYVARSIGGRR